MLRRFLHTRAGFTIMELLIFSAIFALVMISFITILVAITRIQSRQSAVAEVNQQSQFLLEQIQYYVERSSLVEMNQDVVTSTLKLRMAASAEDPTYIYVSSSMVYLKQTATGTPQALTTSRVNVTSLVFTKHSSASGHDSVSVSFVVANNTPNVTQQFSEALRTAIARVSAATFDSDIRASSSNMYVIGAAGQEWKSINNTIFFSGSNVGIGTASPQQTLEVNGVLRLNTSVSSPACNSSARGTIWISTHTTNATDTIQVCLEKSDNSTYFWAVLY
jgi:competence protein ComGC